MIDFSRLEFSTINELFERMSHRGATPVAMWKSGSEWKEVTSQQMYGRVRGLVALLQSWGIERGDRFGLVSENRWEWPVVDFAVLAIGAVDVPLYDTLLPESGGFDPARCRGAGGYRFQSSAVQETSGGRGDSHPGVCWCAGRLRVGQRRQFS
jgi:acyl-CoA synthetase (AMP-forming)/AMP-acid ligase II